MEKVLYTIADCIRHPAIGGPYLRVENSIKALNLISELHLIVRTRKQEIGGDVTESFFQKICHKLLYTPAASINKKSITYKLKRIFLGKRKALETISDEDFLIEYARNNHIKIIWFGYGNISYDLMKKIKTKAPELKLVCDTDSVWSRFVLRGMPFATSEQERLKIEEEGHRKEMEEQEWVNFCDVTTAVSEVDADYYKNLAIDKSRIHLFSNVIDMDNYVEKIAAPRNFRQPNIYLAGYFGIKSPMDVAARWVISEVLPIIKQKIPNIHFYIVGNNSKETLKDICNDNVTVIGRVDSVLPYLCNTNVAIVPLKFESGTRFKILEAAACGIPIVSTTLGAEGIPVKDGENIFIADEAFNFAESIVKLIRNPGVASSIASNLKNYVRQNYSIEKHANEALKIIDYLK